MTRAVLDANVFISGTISAIESKANYVVTGDKPLLSFDWKGQFRVVTPRQFWETELALIQARL